MTISHKDNGAGATLATSVYDQLRTDILRGNLLPGERLRAEFLRERYKVGNSPVREALNRLSSDGLAVRQDQKGFHVATVSKADLLELVKTRCWVEELALRESISQGGMEWEERLVLAFHRMSRLPRSLNEDKYTENPEWDRAHREYHMVLLSGCGSRWLLEFCGQLYDQANRYRYLAVMASFTKRNELDEHREIMEVAIGGDEAKAISLLRKHYNRTAEVILNSDSVFLEA
ncbi:MAG: FCD domain-containing protein [Rhodospirillales bacterium]|nr:FCD domain-containing protein [Rhodospirillales bacterium]